METISLLSLLLEAKSDFDYLPFYKEDIATQNLGFLIPFYAGIWPGEDEDYITSALDVFADNSKDNSYKNSFREFTKFPALTQIINDKYKKFDKDLSKTQDKKQEPSKDVERKTIPASKLYNTIETSSDGKVTVYWGRNKKGEDWTNLKTVNNKDLNPEKDVAQFIGPNTTIDKKPTTSYRDFDTKDTPTQKDVIDIDKKLDSKKNIDKSFKFVNNKEELEDLLILLLSRVSDENDIDSKTIKNYLLQIVQRLDAKGEPEPSSTSTSNTKITYDYVKENNTKDVERVNQNIANFTALNPATAKINTREEIIQYILRVILPELNPQFLKKSSDIKQAIRNALKNYPSKENLNEAFTPEESKKIYDNFLSIIATRRNKLVKNYGPEAENVAYATAVKQIDKEAKEKPMEKEIEEGTCGYGIDGKIGNTPAGPDMLAIRLKEMVKDALKKPLKEKMDPVGKEDKDINNDGKVDKTDDYLMNRRKAIGKAMQKEDIDVGHTDDEPGMLKADLYRIGKYAMELYKMVDKFDKMDSEVDFPHWWQSKISKSKGMLVAAKHYLDFEMKEPQIDAMVDVASEEGVIDEKLKPSMGAGAYVDDFKDSKAPQFKGKSKKKKQEMAVAAYLSAKDKKKLAETIFNKLKEGESEYAKVEKQMFDLKKDNKIDTPEYRKLIKKRAELEKRKKIS